MTSNDQLKIGSILDLDKYTIIFSAIISIAINRIDFINNVRPNTLLIKHFFLSEVNYSNSNLHLIE